MRSLPTTLKDTQHTTHHQFLCHTHQCIQRIRLHTTPHHTHCHDTYHARVERRNTRNTRHSKHLEILSRIPGQFLHLTLTISAQSGEEVTSRSIRHHHVQLATTHTLILQPQPSKGVEANL